MSEINELINNFNNLNINNTLIRAYIEYNNKHHNDYYFYNYINNHSDNYELLLEINNLFKMYSDDVKNDLEKYHIYHINERSAEFLICILAYVDNFFVNEYYHKIYMEAIENLQEANLYL
jgi:UDP-glucose 6-dehydrogenase